MGARNDWELKNFLKPKLQKVARYVVEKIWNENRELIRVIVYEAYAPEMYERTNEFKEAWKTETKMLSNNLQGIFEYAPEKLRIGTNGQHNSLINREEDVRPYLAEIIYQGLSGDFLYGKNDSESNGDKHYAKDNPFFASQAWTKKRDVWDALIKRIGERNMKKWIKEGFGFVGLSVHSHGTPLGVKFYDSDGN